MDWPIPGARIIFMPTRISLVSANLDFDQRFVNWRRWCIARGHYQARAGSAEGGYSSPQGKGQPSGWGDYVLSPLPSITQLPIDVVDAIQVNRAFAGLAARARRVIVVIWFRSHWRPSWQAQKIQCRVVDLSDKAHWAKLCLANHLNRIEGRGRLTPATHNSGSLRETVMSRLGTAFSLSKGE